MGNKCNEQSMINSICKNYPQLCLKTESGKNVQGQTNKCDLAIQFCGMTYYLETKHSHETNTANYAKQMLTECLINRKYHGAKQSYGILVNINKSDSTQFCLLSYVKKHIREEDWNAFGKHFNCTMIFLFDESKEELYYIKWDALFDNSKPTLISKQ